MTRSTVPDVRARVRARKGEGELLRDEIIAATEALLVRTGDASAVSVRAIADAVGVTPPSIYLHFADKSELLYAVGEAHFAAPIVRLRKKWPEKTASTRKLFGVWSPRSKIIAKATAPTASPTTCSTSKGIR